MDNGFKPQKMTNLSYEIKLSDYRYYQNAKN